MDAAWALLIWAVIVVLSMLIVIVLATRWGHDPFGFALLAAVLGPIAIVALVGTHQADREKPHVFERGTPSRAGRRAVLVAIDGSEVSGRVATAVASLGIAGVEAIVLSVLPHEARPDADATPPRLQEHQRQVDRMSADALRALASAGVPSRVIVGYGVPGEEIVAAAKDESAEMIVIGRRGAGLSKALLGSASDYVLKHASVPVVVID